MQNADRSTAAAAGPPATHRLRRALAVKAGDLLPLCDFAGLLLGGYASVLAYGRSGLSPLVWIAAAVAPFILYERRFAALAVAADHAALLRGFAARMLMLLGVLWAIAFAGRWTDDAPFAWIAFWFGSAMLVTVGSRVALARYLRRLARRGALAESVAVVGAGPVADRLIPLLEGHAVLFGLFDDPDHRIAAGVRAAEGTLDGLVVRARVAAPDRILIALPGATERQLLSIIERLRPLGVPVELCPQNVGLRLPEHAIGYVGESLPVALLADRPIKRWNIVLKAGEDLVLGGLVTLLLLPLLACIALAIRLDSPGPALFRQRRHGFNNSEFDIYKFRTMQVACAPAPGAMEQTVRGDPRITRVGRFLRKWSLDELPQVFNVLNGSMSLVGPRPHAVDMRTERQLGHEITGVYPHRHRVRPGITGWSQINGLRGATHTVDQLRRRVEFDLFYVENWSLLLDIRILFRTFREVLRATNAF